MTGKYYTSKELMDYFKVSRYSLFRAQKKGLLNPIKRGRENLYSQQDVENYIKYKGVS